MRPIFLRLLLALFIIWPAVGHAGWPSLVNYKRTLRQYGAGAFSGTLSTGAIKKNQGDVVARSGRTAAIFEVTTPADKRTWAVRVFLQEPNMERQVAIAQAIRESGLGEGGAEIFPHMEVVKEGVQVQDAGKAKWFPVIKMGMVKGKKLDNHIEAAIAQGKHVELEALAEEWRSVMGKLRAAKIGHGDLQHNNIMVVDGKIKLIDLDDLFIEKFRGQDSIGNGHEAYAHPTRQARDYYVDVDNFSSLVVYVSLKALAHEPALWHDKVVVNGQDHYFHISDQAGGGDNLLFRQSDFVDPENSPIFKRLAKSTSAEVRKLAAQLAEFSERHISQVPPIESVVGKAKWTPDGTVPKDYEEVVVEKAPVAVEEPESEPTTAPAKTSAPSKPVEPGANATAEDWAAYRMRLLKFNRLKQ